MAIALALASAAVFGVADFFGGMASRRAAATLVAALCHLVGVVLLVLLLPVLPGDPTTGDLALGGVAGLAGATGMVLFFRGLAAGPMSVVAPLTAVTSAGLPLGVGLLLGERPTLAAVGGVGLALAAVVLVSLEPGTSRRRALAGLRSPAMVQALAAGVGFGTFFAVLGQTSHAAGLWPLASARVVSVTLLVAAAVAGGARLRGRVGGALPLVLASGALDMTANVLYLVAVRGGFLTLVAVIASLYPVSTVLLARVVLHERLAPAQLAGLGAAAVGVALIAT